jgi:hypothetical protein
MKTCLLFLFCTVLLASMMLPAGAASSFFGPTGLITMPTAAALDQGKLDFFLNYVSRDGSQETPYGLNFGLGHGIEAGVASVPETGLSAQTIINAKWSALAETDTRPAVAIGAINAAANTGFEGSFIDTAEGKIDPYIVASKKLSFAGCSLPITGSAGYIGGNINGLMLGACASVSPKLDVMADWVGNWSGLSFGARYKAADSLNLEADLIDGDFALGTTYTFALK